MDRFWLGSWHWSIVTYTMNNSPGHKIRSETYVTCLKPKHVHTYIGSLPTEHLAHSTGTNPTTGEMEMPLINVCMYVCTLYLRRYLVCAFEDGMPIILILIDSAARGLSFTYYASTINTHMPQPEPMVYRTCSILSRSGCCFRECSVLYACTLYVHGSQSPNIY